MCTPKEIPVAPRIEDWDFFVEVRKSQKENSPSELHSFA